MPQIVHVFTEVNTAICYGYTFSKYEIIDFLGADFLFLFLFLYFIFTFWVSFSVAALQEREFESDVGAHYLTN